jgi:hypothetical protein
MDREAFHKRFIASFMDPAFEPESVAISRLEAICWRRLKVDPPCRLNIDPGRVAAF